MANSPTILVVDDDEALVDFVQMALESEGYEVVTAKDGWTAFEQLGDFAPDLILLDVGMPEMDGIEFAEVYRKLPGGPVPIVIMSGRQGTFETTEGLRVSGYLDKPFGVEELLATAEKYAPKDSSRRVTS